MSRRPRSRSLPVFSTVAETESPTELSARLTEHGTPNEDNPQRAKGIESDDGGQSLEEGG
jgi:hypothetical protein